MASNQSGNDSDKLSITEYRDICQSEYTKDMDDMDLEIQGLAEYMTNAYVLSENKHLLYKKRQKYIKRKFEIADKIVFLNKNLSTLRKNKMNNYKFGNVKHADGTAIKPANDFERKLYLEADLSTFEETKQILDNHISLIEDSIKTVADMIFGIGYVIQLEEFKKPLK